MGEALNLVARNQRMCHGGITGFAHSTGRSVSTTSHKFDPSHTSHILNIYDVLDFLRYVSAEGGRSCSMRCMPSWATACGSSFRRFSSRMCRPA
ncbi:hypothetical protein P4056_14720 [Pseudomonas aeruginosa]|nr:hypothetical protein [Pseudomonas aeruginosa]